MSKYITWGGYVDSLLLWHNICCCSCALYEYFIIMKSCKIWREDKAIKCTKLTATTHTKKIWIFLFGLISAYVNLVCVHRLNNSRMESVTITLLRCECVNVRVPFFSQIHTLEGREPACLRAFLVLKDWNIPTHIAVDCVVCCITDPCFSDMHWCPLRHYVVCSQMQQSFVHGPFKVLMILFQKRGNICLHLI